MTTAEARSAGASGDRMTTDALALTRQQVQSYVDDGYLVVRGLLSGSELETARGEVVRFARGDYQVHGVPELPEGATDEEATQRVLAVHFPHWASDTTQELMRHAGVVSALSQIAAAHLPHWDGRVKLFQSMLFVKGPGMPGQAWHQDERFIATRDRSLVGAWMALDPATTDNGCLWVIPGSHRNGEIFQVRPHDDPDEFDPSDEAYGFDASAAVPVEVDAGDVVFFNGYLLHRSLKNRAQIYRRALVGHYLNAWSPLPFSFRHNPAMLDFRTVTPVAGEDPYAYKGYDEPPMQSFVRPVDKW